MKSIIDDFQKRSEMSGIKERIRAGAPAQSHQAEPPPAQQPQLVRSDQMLARDIVITDMQARIDQLKRIVSSEKHRFDREIIDVRAKVKDLEDREMELSAQNGFLRQAILDGRMGGEIDTKLFGELYDDLVKVDKDEDSEDMLDESSEDGSQPPKSTDNILHRKPERSSRSDLSLRHAATLMKDTNSFIKTTVSNLDLADGHRAGATDAKIQVSSCRYQFAQSERVRLLNTDTTFVLAPQPPRPGGLTRTLSATVDNFLLNTYDPAVPRKIRRSTSHSNVLLPPSPVQPRSPLTRLGTTIGPGKSPKLVSPLRKIQSSASLSRASSPNGSRAHSPARSARSKSPVSSPCMSPGTAQRQVCRYKNLQSINWKTRKEEWGEIGAFCLNMLMLAER
jgi:hypothetical protein